MRNYKFLAFLVGLLLAWAPYSYATDWVCVQAGDYSTIGDPAAFLIDRDSGFTTETYSGSTTGWLSGSNQNPAWVKWQVLGSGQTKKWIVGSSNMEEWGSCSSFWPQYPEVSGTDYDPLPPSFVPNGVQDGDEDGIDCGGTTGVACQSYCPDGSTWKQWLCSDCADPNEVTLEGCFFTTSQDQFGNCPAGYIKGFENENNCIASAGEQYLAGPGTPVQEGEIPQPPGFSGGTISGTSTTGTSTQNNPDGTSTKTTTTTTTASDGTTSTETTTDTYSGPDGTGTKTGSTTASESTGIPEENPENYDFELGQVPDNVYDVTVEPPEESDLVGLLEGFFNNAPLIEMIDTLQINTANAACTIYGPVMYGQAINIDFCRWESKIEILGFMLLAFAQGYSLLIVYRGWK